MFTFNSISQLDNRTVVRLELQLAGVLSKSLVASINNACDSVEDAGEGAVLLVLLKQASVDKAEPVEAVDVHLVNHWERALRRLERLDAASVATIEGQCSGLGLAVMLTTDYRIAAPEVRLNLAGVDGILPGMTLHRLANQVGVAAARQLTAFGMDMGVARAEQLGMVDTVAADTEAAAINFIKHLGTLNTDDLSVRRRLLIEASSLSYDDALGSHLAACDRLLRKGRNSAAVAQDAAGLSH
jgi:isomerase DpgB